MKALALVFGLMTIVSSNAMAAKGTILGDYSAPAAVRFPTTKAACLADHGEFEQDENDDRGMCTIANESTVSTIKIAKNSQGRILVDILVLFGAIHERSFSGIVTKRSGNTLSVSEVADDGANGETAKDGCEMKVTIKGKAADIDSMNEKCDGNLARASGAVKK